MKSVEFKNGSDFYKMLIKVKMTCLQYKILIFGKYFVYSPEHLSSPRNFEMRNKLKCL